MNFDFNGDIWKLGLLVLGAALAYGAGFISQRLVEDEDKKMKLKIALKIAGFVLVIIAAVTVMFL